MFRLTAESVGLPFEFPGELFPEMFGKRKYVLRAFMQGRQDDFKFPQTVVEVFPEASLPDGQLKVLVC